MPVNGSSNYNAREATIVIQSILVDCAVIILRLIFFLIEHPAYYTQ